MIIKTVDEVKLDWKDIREILIFLPIAHIALCFVFLLFYSISFGSSIEAFFSPVDVFHVSFGDIAPGYLGACAAITVGALFGARLGRRNDKPAGVPAHGHASHSTIRDLLLISVSALMLLGSIVFGVILFRFTDRVALSCVIATMGSALFLWLSISLFRSKRIWPFVVWLALIPVFASAVAGASAAERDSVETYTSARESRPSCGNYVVLRNAGEHFIAVTNDYKHVLINNECKLQFLLQPRFSSAVFAKLREAIRLSEDSAKTTKMLRP